MKSPNEEYLLRRRYDRTIPPQASDPDKQNRKAKNKYSLNLPQERESIVHLIRRAASQVPLLEDRIAPSVSRDR